MTSWSNHTVSVETVTRMNGWSWKLLAANQRQRQPICGAFCFNPNVKLLESFLYSKRKRYSSRPAKTRPQQGSTATSWAKPFAIWRTDLARMMYCGKGEDEKMTMAIATMICPLCYPFAIWPRQFYHSLGTNPVRAECFLVHWLTDVPLDEHYRTNCSNSNQAELFNLPYVRQHSTSGPQRGKDKNLWRKNRHHFVPVFVLLYMLSKEDKRCMYVCVCFFVCIRVCMFGCMYEWVVLFLPPQHIEQHIPWSVAYFRTLKATSSFTSVFVLLFHFPPMPMKSK